MPRDLRSHTRAFPCLERDVGERVGPEFGDEMRVSARHSARDSLVGSLAAGSEREKPAEDGLAHLRQTIGPVGCVGDENAENHDLSAHFTPPAR